MNPVPWWRRRLHPITRLGVVATTIGGMFLLLGISDGPNEWMLWASFLALGVGALVVGIVRFERR